MGHEGPGNERAWIHKKIHNFYYALAEEVEGHLFSETHAKLLKRIPQKKVY